jgi:hypothetical protein
MADLYDRLTPAQQAAFRVKLAGQISAAACPAVDLTGVAGADSLADVSDRAMAVDCFQQAKRVGSAGAGVLDQATYNAVMSGGSGAGSWETLPTWEKFALIGGAAFLAFSLLKGKRGRRGPRGKP